MEPTKEKTVTAKPVLGLTPGMRIMGDECFRYGLPDVKPYSQKFSKDIEGIENYTFVHFDSLKDFYDFVVSTSLTYGPECFKEVCNGKPYQRVYIEGCANANDVNSRIIRLKLEQAESTGQKSLFELFVHIGNHISDLFQFLSHYSIRLTDKHTLTFIDSKSHLPKERLSKFSYSQFTFEDPLFGNNPNTLHGTNTKTLLDAIWLHSLGDIAKDTLSAVIVRNICGIISDQNIVKRLKVKAPFIVPCNKTRRPLAVILAEEKPKSLEKVKEKPSPSPKKQAGAPKKEPSRIKGIAPLAKATPLPKKVITPKEDDLCEAVSSKDAADSVNPFTGQVIKKTYPASSQRSSSSSK